MQFDLAVVIYSVKPLGEFAFPPASMTEGQGRGPGACATFGWLPKTNLLMTPFVASDRSVRSDFLWSEVGKTRGGPI